MFQSSVSPTFIFIRLQVQTIFFPIYFQIILPGILCFLPFVLWVSTEILSYETGHKLSKNGVSPHWFSFQMLILCVLLKPLKLMYSQKFHSTDSSTIMRSIVFVAYFCNCWHALALGFWWPYSRQCFCKNVVRFCCLAIIWWLYYWKEWKETTKQMVGDYNPYTMQYALSRTLRKCTTVTFYSLFLLLTFAVIMHPVENNFRCSIPTTYHISCHFISWWPCKSKI